MSFLLACGPSCPDGFGADPARARRIEQLAGVSAEMCFGPVADLGVLAGRRMLLDADTTEPVLAARVVHLAHHRSADGGADCRARLRREEARAWLAEHDHRIALGVRDALLPDGVTATLPEIERWLTRQDDPVSRALATSHARRCGPTSAIVAPSKGEAR